MHEKHQSLKFQEVKSTPSKIKFLFFYKKELYDTMGLSDWLKTTYFFFLS